MLANLKIFLTVLFADNYNVIFENFVKRVRSIIINIYTPLREASRNKSVFVLNLG